MIGNLQGVVGDLNTGGYCTAPSPVVAACPPRSRGCRNIWASQPARRTGKPFSTQSSACCGALPASEAFGWKDEGCFSEVWEEAGANAEHERHQPVSNFTGYAGSRFGASRFRMRLSRPNGKATLESEQSQRPGHRRHLRKPQHIESDVRSGRVGH